MYNYYRRFRIRNGIETTLPQDRSFNIYYASFKFQEKNIVQLQYTKITFSNGIDRKITIPKVSEATKISVINNTCLHF